VELIIGDDGIDPSSRGGEEHGREKVGGDDNVRLKVLDFLSIFTGGDAQK